MSKISTGTRERPIRLNPHEVRAILAGRQTMVRRVVKLRDPSQTYSTYDDDGWPVSADEAGDWHRDSCPYGRPGDVLWCRETWAYLHGQKDHTGRDPDAIWYRADGQARFVGHDGRSLTGETWDAGVREAEVQVTTLARWRPSIHMPHWASRLTLRVEAVRVERVREISEEDARAEGVFAATAGLDGRAYDVHQREWCRRTRQIDPDSLVATARAAFAILWDSINKSRGFGWDANPWCWCVTFSRLADAPESP